MGETTYGSDSESSTASTVIEPTEEQVTWFSFDSIKVSLLIVCMIQIALSEELKAEANKAFQEDHYAKALELYTR